MRTISKDYPATPYTVGTVAFDKLSANHLTRASVSATVSAFSGLDGSVTLQGSNALVSDSGQHVAGNLEPSFRVPESSWFDLDGGSVALGTASGTVATSTSFSARWLRAVVKLDSGTGTVTVRVHASNEAA